MTAPPIVVEMLGLPGSGKTTIRVRLSEALAAHGFRSIGLPADARELALRGWTGPLVRRLPDSWQGPAGWLVYRVWTGWLAARVSLSAPNAMFGMYRIQRRRPSQTVRKARRAGYWYLRHVGDHALFMKTARPGEIWLVDEGFAHRVVSLFASHVGLEAPDEVIVSYLAAAPAPDLVLHVTAPLDVCLDRVRARAVWDWLRPMGTAGLAAFGEAAAQAVEIARRFADSHWAVIEIDNALEGSVPALAEAVERITGTRVHG